MTNNGTVNVAGDRTVATAGLAGNASGVVNVQSGSVLHWRSRVTPATRAPSSAPAPW